LDFPDFRCRFSGFPLPSSRSIDFSRKKPLPEDCHRRFTAHRKLVSQSSITPIHLQGHTYTSLLSSLQSLQPWQSVSFRIQKEKCKGTGESKTADYGLDVMCRRVMLHRKEQALVQGQEGNQEGKGRPFLPQRSKSIASNQGSWNYRLILDGMDRSGTTSRLAASTQSRSERPWSTVRKE
jgi:hypothetical protein